MPAAPDWAAIFTDVISCLGLGLGLAALRDAIGLVLGNGKVLCFVWDVLGFAVGAVLLFGFASGQSAVGVTRWYMVGGMAAGALGWYAGFARVPRAILEQLLRLMLLPYRVLRRYILMPVKQGAKYLWNKAKPRKNIKISKKSKKKLQSRRNVLYN